MYPRWICSLDKEGSGSALKVGEKLSQDFTYFIVANGHIRVFDNRSGELSDVLVKDNKLWCNRCKAEKCSHTEYARQTEELKHQISP